MFYFSQKITPRKTFLQCIMSFSELFCYLSAITLNLYWMMLPSCPNPALNFHPHMSRLHYCNHLYSPDHNQNTLYLQSSAALLCLTFPVSSMVVIPRYGNASDMIFFMIPKPMNYYPVHPHLLHQLPHR